MESFSDGFDDSSVFPLEVPGQVVATCRNLVEVAMDSSADMVVWGFSAEGWAAAWAMDTGGSMTMTKSSVQTDGSIRYIDANGDVVMGGVEVPMTPTSVVEDLHVPALDGACASHSTSRPPKSAYRMRRVPDHDVTFRAGWIAGDRMSGTASVELIEEISGIARVDVELR